MPALPRHELRPKNRPIISRVHRHPFVMFGLPFVATIVGASFALTTFTQTRYDLRDQQVTSIEQEDQLKMAKDRRKIDIREEYYRLSASGESDSDDWDNKLRGPLSVLLAVILALTIPLCRHRRVPRLPGQAEWGELPPERPSASKPQ